MQDNRLLVVYDSRFIGANIYGHIGGSERQVEPLLTYPDRRSATQCSYCPKCQTRRVGVYWCASVAMPFLAWGPRQVILSHPQGIY